MAGDPLDLFATKNYHNDEELVQLAKDLNAYAIQGLRDLRNAYPKIPKDLIAHENFFKDIIASSSVFLAETHNWYTNERKDQSS